MYEDRRLPFTNVQELKEAVTNNWKEVCLESVRKSIAQCKRRLNKLTFN